VTGTLPVANGGTGSSTLTANNVLLGNGTSALQAIAPSSSGNVLTSNGTTWASTAPAAAGFTLGTPVASTSGTSINFTGIPAGVKQIVVSFTAVSTNGGDSKIIQLGDAGGVETTNYVSTSSSISAAGTGTATNNAGFFINSLDAAHQLSGSMIFTLENSTTNRWCAVGTFSDRDGYNTAFISAGSKALSQVCDRVRITTSYGTDAFDLGEINIAYI
jgi:hypothetical protein